jgi:hypothetical protein
MSRTATRDVFQRSKRRRRYRCGRKWGYPSRRNAASDLSRLEERSGDTGLEVYHCPRCQGFHVGHKQPRFEGH